MTKHTRECQSSFGGISSYTSQKIHTKTDEQNSRFQETPTSSEEQGFCLDWITAFHDCVLSYTMQLSVNIMLQWDSKTWNVYSKVEHAYCHTAMSSSPNLLINGDHYSQQPSFLMMHIMQVTGIWKLEDHSSWMFWEIKELIPPNKR